MVIHRILGTDRHGSHPVSPALLRRSVPSGDAGARLPQPASPLPMPERTTGSYTWGSSFEAWPAAGGGMLVGVFSRELAGACLPRPSLKTAFLKVDWVGCCTVILPYVSLEDEAAACAGALVGAELGQTEPVPVKDGAATHPGRRSDGQGTLTDLVPQAERALCILAASVRSMLLAAAAQRWRVGVSKCRVAERTIVSPSGKRTFHFADVVQDAAFETLPRAVRFASGIEVKLQP